MEYDPDEPFPSPVQQDERISSLISFVEDKHPYIIFDPFELHFKLLKDRHRSKLYYAQQNRLFNEAKSDSQKLCELARSWYPDADISVACSVNMLLTQDLVRHNMIAIRLHIPSSRNSWRL